MCGSYLLKPKVYAKTAALECEDCQDTSREDPTIKPRGNHHGRVLCDYCSDTGYQIRPTLVTATTYQPGPSIDDPSDGPKYTLAPESVSRACQRRFERGGPAVLHPDKPGHYLHDVGNFWDGPSTVKDEGDGTLSYNNPYTHQSDRFDEHGYYDSEGNHTPWHSHEASVKTAMDERGRTWDICSNCGEKIHDVAGIDPNVPWVHADSGNSKCDVSSPADAVMLQGVATPESDPMWHHEGRKTATQFEQTIAAPDGRILLRVGDSFRLPTGQTTKVKNVRRHETLSGHYYVDTDLGTALQRGDSKVSVVPNDPRSQALPSFADPRGNSNALPGGVHRSAPGQSHVGEVCSVCGGNTMTERGTRNVCNRCGYSTSSQGDMSFTDTPQIIGRPHHGSVTASQSAVSRRAAEVYELMKENPL
jgi:hypothetical protein